MRLNDLLGDEFQTPDAKLALDLAREDQKLLADLVELRKARGVRQEDLAEILGLSQATISAFERIGNDPHLSSVRRYARALGVMIRHHVDPDPATCNDSHYLSHVTSKGITSTATAASAARTLRASAAQWPAAATASNPSRKSEDASKAVPV